MHRTSRYLSVLRHNGISQREHPTVKAENTCHVDLRNACFSFEASVHGISQRGWVSQRRRPICYLSINVKPIKAPDRLQPRSGETLRLKLQSGVAPEIRTRAQVKNRLYRAEGTITRRVPTRRWSGRHPLNSPAERGFQSNRQFHRSRKFPPLTGY
jgi:hypothetical protein